MDGPCRDHTSELVVLHHMPLRDVLALDESVLAHALRRLWHEADHPEEILAGWQSAV